MPIVYDKSSSQVSRTVSSDLPSEIRHIRALVELHKEQPSEGKGSCLPGAVAFLSEGRVLCRDRQRGDSRYPYGHNGFTFWVHASGRMSANQGLFFWLLPSDSGQEPPVAAFAGFQTEGEKSFRSHSLFPTPVVRDNEDRIIDRYTVMGHDATYFFTETPELLSVVRVLLEQNHEGEATLYFSYYLENIRDRPLAAYLSTYLNPFCRHQFGTTNEDRWFKRITVASEATADTASSSRISDFLIQTNEDINRFESVSNQSIIRRAISFGGPSLATPPKTQILFADSPGEITSLSEGDRRIYAQQCTSWLDYVGSSRRSLASAEFLEHGKLQQCTPVTTFNENAIAGDLQRFVLAEKGYFRSDFAWSILSELEVSTNTEKSSLTTEEVDAASTAAQERVKQHSGALLHVDGEQLPELKAETFNRFVPYLQRQVAVCAQVRGYMQSSPNSLIGFRDIMQAIEGRLIDDSHWARGALLETLEYVLREGKCPRQYLPSVAGKPAQADLRDFVDQGVWAVSTVLTYVRVSGDRTLLEEQVGYHRTQNNDESALFPDNMQDTVLDHLLRIVEYLVRQRDSETGLICALYGDWNDAIDGLGLTSNPMAKYGNGVSVMTSLQFYQNCQEMIELLSISARDDRSDLIERHQTYRKQMQKSLLQHAVVSRGAERRILHGWGDLQSFFVGGFEDVDGLSRDGLTSNAFWVLSGMLEVDDTFKEEILCAFDRLDSQYGLKTFAPGFGVEATPVGRIARLPIGSAENGAVYVHATAFAIAALFMMGEPKRAWEQIVKILPFSPHHKDPSHSPFVMPNSYCDCPELNLTGQSMNDWQTGSSNVLWKTLVRFAFGFYPRLDHLRMAPASWSPFSSMRLDVRAHGRDLRLIRRQGEVSRRTIIVNGSQDIETVYDETMAIDYATIPYDILSKESVNEIVVIDPISK